MNPSRRAKILEQLIMDEFDRMMAVKTRGEQQHAFTRMSTLIDHRSPQQIRAMEHAKGLDRKWRH